MPKSIVFVREPIWICCIESVAYIGLVTATVSETIDEFVRSDRDRCRPRTGPAVRRSHSRAISAVGVMGDFYRHLRLLISPGIARRRSRRGRPKYS
jgi:hypothetical protein